jgi:hypothetical protein
VTGGLRKDVWIMVSAECPMDAVLEQDTGFVHITLGSTDNGADLVFTSGALHRLVVLAAAVLPHPPTTGSPPNGPR